MSIQENMNIIVAPISFSTGSAGSMRLRSLINELKLFKNVTLTNLISSKEENQIDERFYSSNITYRKLGYSALFGRLLEITSIYSILKYKKMSGKNILYFYSCVFNPLDNYIFFIARILGYKLVFDETELFKTKLTEVEGFSYIKFLLIALNQHIIKFVADHIFCISHEILKYYKKKSSLLPISCNNEAKPQREQYILKNDITLFYSGSFETKDNVHCLIKACSNIHQNGYPFVLSLCGKMTLDEKQVLNDLIEKCKLKKKVFLHGFLEIDAYYNELSSADICIVPRSSSKFANTGFPFKLGEYLSFGKPCIVSNTGDISLYLSPDDVYFVDPDNIEQLEQAITKMIKQEGLRKNFSRNGKRKADLHFNPKSHIKKMLKIFHNL